MQMKSVRSSCCAQDKTDAFFANFMQITISNKNLVLSKNLFVLYFHLFTFTVGEKYHFRILMLFNFPDVNSIMNDARIQRRGINDQSIN